MSLELLKARRQKLKTMLKQQYDLLNESEDKFLAINSPLEKANTLREIRLIKSNVRYIIQELVELQEEVKKSKAQKSKK